jgi:hypothetical protein
MPPPKPRKWSFRDRQMVWPIDATVMPALCVADSHFYKGDKINDLLELPDRPNREEDHDRFMRSDCRTHQSN